MSYNLGGKDVTQMFDLETLINDTHPDVIFLSETHQDSAVFTERIMAAYRWIGTSNAECSPIEITNASSDPYDVIDHALERCLAEADKHKEEPARGTRKWKAGEVGFLLKPNVECLEALCTDASRLSMAIKIKLPETQPLWIVGGYCKYAERSEEMVILFKLWQWVKQNRNQPEGIMLGDFNARTGDWGTEWGRVSCDRVVTEAGSLLMELSALFDLRPAESPSTPTTPTFTATRKTGNGSSVIDYILINDSIFENLHRWTPIKWNPATITTGHAAVGVKYPMPIDEPGSATRATPRPQLRKFKTPPVQDRRYVLYGTAISHAAQLLWSQEQSTPTVPPTPAAVEVLHENIIRMFHEAATPTLGCKVPTSDSHSFNAPVPFLSSRMRVTRRACTRLRRRADRLDINDPTKKLLLEELQAKRRIYRDQVKKTMARREKREAWQLTQAINRSSSSGDTWHRIKGVINTSTAAISHGPLPAKIRTSDDVYEKSSEGVASILAGHLAAASTAIPATPEWKDTIEDHKKRLQPATPLSLDSETFTWLKVRESIRRFSRCGSAPGPDQISPEMLRRIFIEKKDEHWKEAQDEAQEPVYKMIGLLFDRVARTGYMPRAWLVARCAPLYKNKGDRAEVSSYRSIMVSDVLQRVFFSMVNQRAQSWSDEHNRRTPSQRGFRSKSSTNEAIFTLCELMKLAIKKNISGDPAAMLVGFIDFKAAYDSIPCEALLQLLEAIGVGPTLISLVRQLCEEGSARCNDGRGGLTLNVPLRRGVPQGNPLSPLLFSWFIDPLLRFLESDAQVEGVNIRLRTHLYKGETARNHVAIAFADDIALTASTVADLQRMFSIVQTFADAAGMTLNFGPNKTAILPVCPQRFAAKRRGKVPTRTRLDNEEMPSIIIKASPSPDPTSAAYREAPTIPVVFEYKHLGLWTRTAKGEEKTALVHHREYCLQRVRQQSSLISRLTTRWRHIPAALVSRLWSSLFRSVLNYAVHVVNPSPSFQDYEAIIQRAAKRILRLPPQAAGEVAVAELGWRSFQAEVECNAVKFFNKLMTSLQTNDPLHDIMREEAWLTLSRSFTPVWLTTFLRDVVGKVDTLTDIMRHQVLPTTTRFQAPQSISDILSEWIDSKYTIVLDVPLETLLGDVQCSQWALRLPLACWTLQPEGWTPSKETQGLWAAWAPSEPLPPPAAENDVLENPRLRAAAMNAGRRSKLTSSWNDWVLCFGGWATPAAMSRPAQYLQFPFPQQRRKVLSEVRCGCASWMRCHRTHWLRCERCAATAVREEGPLPVAPAVTERCDLCNEVIDKENQLSQRASLANHIGLHCEEAQATYWKGLQPILNSKIAPEGWQTPSNAPSRIKATYILGLSMNKEQSIKPSTETDYLILTNCLWQRTTRPDLVRTQGAVGNAAYRYQPMQDLEVSWSDWSDRHTWQTLNMIFAQVLEGWSSFKCNYCIECKRL